MAFTWGNALAVGQTCGVRTSSRNIALVVSAAWQLSESAVRLPLGWR